MYSMNDGQNASKSAGLTTEGDEFLHGSHRTLDPFDKARYVRLMQNTIWLVLAFALLGSPLSYALDLTKAAGNIPKFRSVTPAIYAGGNPLSRANGTDGLDALIELNVAVSINLQGGDIDGTWIGRAAARRQKGESAPAIAFEKEQFQARGVQFYNFPLNSHAPKTAAEDVAIRAALDLMAQATPDSPVYVHCEHGADRTGLLIALFRVVHQGWTRKEANREWVRNGHGRISKTITWHLDKYFHKFLDERDEAQTSSAGCALDLQVQKN
jgi:protein tyrosine/serine phosphatase